KPDIVDPGIRENLGLGDFLAIDPLRAGSNLLACKRRDLVGLDMRAEAFAAFIQIFLCPRDIPFKYRFVDNRHWRRNLGNGGSGLGPWIAHVMSFVFVEARSVMYIIFIFQRKFG